MPRWINSASCMHTVYSDSTGTYHNLLLMERQSGQKSVLSVDQRPRMSISGLVCQSALFQLSISGLACRSAVLHIDQRSRTSISGLVCRSAVSYVDQRSCMSISGLVHRSAVPSIDQRSCTLISGIIINNACECTMWACH